MSQELYHHGVKGMKWGVRRYQNKDGSLTPAGKKHMQTFKDAAARAREGKKYSDSAYKRFTKLANQEAAKKNKPVSKKAIDKFLRSEFGNDIDSKSGRNTIRYIFEIDDLNEYAKKHLQGGDEEHYRRSALNAKAAGESYVKLNKKFSSMTVNDINKKSLKQAKTFVNDCFGTSYEYARVKAYELDPREWNRDKWLEYSH